MIACYTSRPTIAGNTLEFFLSWEDHELNDQCVLVLQIWAVKSVWVQTLCGRFETSFGSIRVPVGRK
jgi:hypothetical protein